MSRFNLNYKLRARAVRLQRGTASLVSSSAFQTREGGDFSNFPTPVPAPTPTPLPIGFVWYDYLTWVDNSTWNEGGFPKLWADYNYWSDNLVWSET
jgi:hypothetical protein